MGRCVRIVDKKKIKAYFQTAGGTAVACAFVLGMFTHMYALTNNLHNYDDIAIQPAGYGTGIVLGRWLLTMLGDAADMAGVGYNLPFVNGVLFILLLSICAGLLVSLFEIENRVCAGLVGALFVTFPTAASTMFFRYTAVYYGLGILLAVLAAWVLRRYKYGLLLSALCTALSMGIYQAYAPLTIGIFVLMLIRAGPGSGAVLPAAEGRASGLWDRPSGIPGGCLYGKPFPGPAAWADCPGLYLLLRAAVPGLLRHRAEKDHPLAVFAPLAGNGGADRISSGEKGEETAGPGVLLPDLADFPGGGELYRHHVSGWLDLHDHGLFLFPGAVRSRGAAGGPAPRDSQELERHSRKGRRIAGGGDRAV